MKSLVQGVHHITLCPGGAQQDIDFLTQVLGQRLVKQTVLMDGSIPIYHLYYGNADADVGSIATRSPGTTTEIPRDAGTRGFFGAVLSVRDVRDQESFFVDALGFRKVGVDGPYHRFEVQGTGAGRVIDLHLEPERAAGSWGFGAGTAHHIAFNVETDDALVKQKAVYEELGFTDASEIKDRFYFHSMYVRSPGGILVECTANVPGGFYKDEAPEELGTKLHLPPWYEEQREAIVAQLEPITVPEANRPRPATDAVPRPAVAAPHEPVEEPKIPLSRYKA